MWNQRHRHPPAERTKSHLTSVCRRVCSLGHCACQNHLPPLTSACAGTRGCGIIFSYRLKSVVFFSLLSHFLFGVFVCVLFFLSSFLPFPYWLWWVAGQPCHGYTLLLLIMPYLKQHSTAIIITILQKLYLHRLACVDMAAPSRFEGSGCRFTHRSCILPLQFFAFFFLFLLFLLFF